MKKFLASVLALALVLSCMSFAVAENAAPDTYSMIDTFDITTLDYVYNNKSSNGDYTCNFIEGLLTQDSHGTLIPGMAKEFLGDVPDSRANEEFEFTLTRTSAYTEGARTAYANKEYSLYKKGSDGSWEKQSGKYATDAQGRLYLRAGEKAVFASVADADDIQAEETWDPHWLSEQTEEKREDGAGKRILVNNTFRPLLYLSKTLDGYVKTGESEAALKEQEFFFRVTVNGEPAKNADCYVYDQKPSEGTYQKYKEVRVTDENGLVMLHGGEAILLTPGLLGDTFRVEEPAELLGDDWVCQRNNGDGILSEKDSSVTITNYYKWKDLNIRKKTEQYDGEEDPEFTFRIWELPEEEDDSGDTETGPEGYGTAPW